VWGDYLNTLCLALKKQVKNVADTSLCNNSVLKNMGHASHVAIMACHTPFF
jgi:hypothetical protein